MRGLSHFAEPRCTFCSIHLCLLVFVGGFFIPPPPLLALPVAQGLPGHFLGVHEMPHGGEHLPITGCCPLQCGGALTQGVPSTVASPLPTRSHQRQLVDFETHFLSKFNCSPAQIPKPGFVAMELKALSGFLARSLALLLQAGNKAAIILHLGRKGHAPSSCRPKSQTNHHQHALQQQYESH